MHVVKTLNNALKISIMGELDKIETMIVIYSHLGESVRIAELEVVRADLESILLDIMSQEAA